MADWASLPTDIIRRVGDVLLDDGDIDYYTGMRSVCHNWRSATADPRRHGVGVASIRFHPRQWTMLDKEGSLFINVSTGRFLRRRFPSLPDYREQIVVGISDGLLLVEKGYYTDYPDGVIHILNPLTGHRVLEFKHCPDPEAAGPHRDSIVDLSTGQFFNQRRLMAAFAGSEPSLVLSGFPDYCKVKRGYGC